jgi:outer membrane lipoprotein SlyB
MAASSTTGLEGVLGTAKNERDRIVKRDREGNFKCGTVTGNLVGNVTGNVTGSVEGDVEGNITGSAAQVDIEEVNGTILPLPFPLVATRATHATGTVASDLVYNNSGPKLDTAGNLHGNNFVGDVIGDVTGNVTGNVEGNVTGNVTGSASQVDIEEWTYEFGTPYILPLVATRATHVSGTAASDLVYEVDGPKIDPTGKLQGEFKGDVEGDLTGNVVGNVEGDVEGNLIGDVTGNVTGNVEGNLTGNVTGNVTGDVYHDSSTQVVDASRSVNGLVFNPTGSLRFWVKPCDALFDNDASYARGGAHDTDGSSSFSVKNLEGNLELLAGTGKQMYIYVGPFPAYWRPASYLFVVRDSSGYLVSNSYGNRKIQKKPIANLGNANSIQIAVDYVTDVADGVLNQVRALSSTEKAHFESDGSVMSGYMFQFKCTLNAGDSFQGGYVDCEPFT